MPLINDRQLDQALTRIALKVPKDERGQLLNEVQNWGVEQWPSGKLPPDHILIPQVGFWIESQVRVTFRTWKESKDRYPQLRFTKKFLRDMLDDTD